MKKVCIIIMLLTTIFIPNVVGEYNISGNDENNQHTEKLTTYRVFIDQHYGFYRIYYANVSGKAVQVPYNGTLNIHKGDTVTWINDAEDAAFTIISEQELWKDYDAYLKWAYKQFSHTFNKSGTFTMYIRQSPKFRQKIIVGSRLDSKSNSNNISDSEYLNSEYNSTTNSTTNDTTNDTTNGTTITANKTDVSNTSINSTELNLISSPGPNSTNEKEKLNDTDSLGTNMSKDDLQTTRPGGPIIYMALSLVLVISSFIYVFRKNKDKLLSIILVSSIFLLTNPFGNIASAYTNTHPNMFLNQNEIDTIKTKINNNEEPWKTAYQGLISDANNALGLPIQSVTYHGNTGNDYYTEPPYCGWKRVDGKDPDCRDGQMNPNADREDYTAAIALGKAVRSLGLAYSFTGDTKYADKAIQLINAWSIDPTTKMNPSFTNGQSQIELANTMSGVFYGADLIWNYQGWNNAEKEAFKTWTRNFISSAMSHTWCGDFCQNFENWRLTFISSAAIIAEDSNNLDYAFNRWKEITSANIDTDGSIKYDRDRQAGGFFYSMFNLIATIDTAEIARHQGVDLYNYKTSDGRGLELALDFHAQYVTNTDSWPYTKGGYDTDPGRSKNNAAIYELAYSFKKKTSYQNAINRWGRPMDEARVMGPTTLTHAQVNFGVIGPVPTSGTGIPTTGPTPGQTSPPSGGAPTIFCYKIAKGGRTPTPTPTQPIPSPTPGPTSVPGGEIGTWKYNDVIIIPYGRLHNNIWGATEAEIQSAIMKSYIYYKDNGNFGWEWYRPDPTPDPNDYPTPIYPDIIVGASGPFSSLSPYFPITLRDINSLTIDINYNYTKTPIGGYNLAYDIWFVDSANIKKAEFMVWIYGDLGNADTYVSDGINEYGYFYKPPKSGFEWDYHAFVLKNQDPLPLNHKINMKSLFDVLISSGKVDPNWRMLGIELGNEIGSGSGRIEINKFLINMNGNNIGKS